MATSWTSQIIDFLDNNAPQNSVANCIILWIKITGSIPLISSSTDKLGDGTTSADDDNAISLIDGSGDFTFFFTELTNPSNFLNVAVSRECKSIST